MHAANNIQNFEEAMRFQGLACKEPIIADGKVHRFYVAGDKPGKHNGWYVFYGEVGVYGSWKTGEKFTWFSKGARMSDQIREHLKVQLDKARSDYKVDRHKEHVSVAELSQEKWFSASPANPQHPYLATKQVKAHSLRQIKNHLLLPLIDFHGMLWNLQTIYANGEKRFESGGRVSGLYCPIGLETMTSFTRLMICEGWATGASLHEVMGDFVICAMNAGNLVKVAQGAREHFPDAQIIIAADNDRHTPGNPGLTKALEAAELIQAHAARARLAVFLRALVNSTGLKVEKSEFPGNDDSERPGWDGYVEAGEATPWIPAGKSGWEFGVNQDPKTKGRRGLRQKRRSINCR